MKKQKDKHLYRLLLTIAVPIALQNLLVFLTQMLDTIMLGELGDVPLAASSLANQVFFVFSLFTLGLAGGASVLTAQYWGKREVEPIKTIIATSLRLVMVVSVALTAVVLLFPDSIMKIFTKDPAVIQAGVEYLKVIGLMYFFFGVSNTMICLLRSIELVRVAVLANGTSLVVNGFLNWVLIFGNLGAPRLEVKGAAIATLIAKIAELSIVCVYVFFIDKKIKFRLSDMKKKNKLLSADLRKYCTPVVLNELAWSLGIALQSLLFGRISTLAVSANTIINVVQQLATIFIFGVANAGAVIIGKTIGEGHTELARQRGGRIKWIAVIMGIIGAGIIFSLRNVAVDFYNVDPATKVLAKEMLIITAITVFFISNSGISIVGVLRGGGDTKFSLMIEIVALWCVSVPLGFLGGLVFHLPVVAVYALFKSDEVLKTIVCHIRLLGSKWVRNVTREPEPVELEE